MGGYDEAMAADRREWELLVRKAITRHRRVGHAVRWIRAAMAGEWGEESIQRAVWRVQDAPKFN